MINTYLDRFFATGMEGGSVAAIVYSGKVITLMHSIIIISIANVIFPKLSELKNDTVEQLNTFLISSKLLTFISLPLTFIVLLFSNEIISTLFERGLFDSSAVRLTGEVLKWYALGFLGYAIIEKFTRYAYANHKSWQAVIVGIVIISSNIILNVMLSKNMGPNGIALATSLSFFIGVLFYFTFLIKENEESKKLIFASLVTFLRVIIATVLSYLIVRNYIASNYSFAIDLSIFEKLISLSFVTAKSISVFIFLIILLEIRSLIKWIRRKTT
ncbi:hypothetical protein XYCOK13_40740 [Xylanibacillus composti]|uniref:Uncharacterized protein n=1 Tax=Xylanibacillus composti TaxID=1572762 RepID=A0A8J4M3V4_9BACL|nr:hypothetical protein XYCOK13_40740 [Xylanibacillus composti]